YKELRRDALAADRWNRLHPTEPPRKPYLAQQLEGRDGPVVAATDYIKAVPDLIALAMDEPAGRKLVERSEVDFRTRSFACYGLGLIVYRTKNAELKQKVFEAMKTMVELGTNNRVHRDLIVAPLQSMRLLRPNVETPAGKSLRDDAIEFLSAYMAKPDKEVYAQIRSHAYIAAAELLGRGGDSTGLITTRMMEDVKNRRQKQWIHQSAILALGQIALPENLEVSTAIQDYMKRGKDLQAKYFCAIALGQIGGDKNRSFLISRIKRAKSLEKPWIAVGLAIMDYQVRSKDQNYEGDPTAAMAIKREFDRTKNQMYAAGMAIALGVMKHSDSGDAIMDRLLKVKSQDQPAGYMAVALGLMGYQDAKDTIKSLLETAKRRPKLLTQCAIALGLLGDKEVSTGLITFIQDKQVVAVYSAISQALGWIGDKRSINPLITMLQDKSIKELPRAFAAVALGLVGDKEELPWNSKIAVNNNYRANVETLTGNNGTGILDIL
ncbi:MAG: HEAT repeat domain-containing protein, partial [Planctomycetota bacterium]